MNMFCNKSKHVSVDLYSMFTPFIKCVFSTLMYSLFDLTFHPSLHILIINSTILSVLRTFNGSHSSNV